MDTAALARWYNVTKRDLPWRRHKDPYQVWLSEIMCQQTTIKAVIPYYERFLASFPDVHELANSDLQTVYKLWAGLGYYRRARFLHEAAKQISAQGFPTNYKDLKKLPGVGDYTAAAIASIAYDEQVPVIDGNVERVIARYFAITDNCRKGPGKKLVREKAEQLILGTAPGTHNQAMMELGSLICRPRQLAQCLICPVQQDCQGRQRGLVQSLPTLPPRAKTKKRQDQALAIYHEGRMLYGLRKEGEVWAGLYELPRVVVKGREGNATTAKRIARELLSSTVELLSKDAIAKTKHGVMNERISLEVFPAALRGEPKSQSYEKLVWVSIGEIEQLPLSSPQRKVAKDTFAWWATNRPT